MLLPRELGSFIDTPKAGGRPGRGSSRATTAPSGNRLHSSRGSPGKALRRRRHLAGRGVPGDCLRHRRGFGSRLRESVLAQDKDGKVEIASVSTGLVSTVETLVA